jgi:hypothetical protein
MRFPALATEKSRKNGARSYCCEPSTGFIANVTRWKRVVLLRTTELLLCDL